MSHEYHQYLHIVSFYLVCAWASSNILIGWWNWPMDTNKKCQHEKKYFYYEDGQRQKQVCPEKLWILMFWRHSKTNWMHPKQSHPLTLLEKWKILWSQEVPSKSPKFCNSVNFSSVSMRDLKSSEYMHMFK